MWLMTGPVYRRLWCNLVVSGGVRGRSAAHFLSNKEPRLPQDCENTLEGANIASVGDRSAYLTDVAGRWSVTQRPSKFIYCTLRRNSGVVYLQTPLCEVGWFRLCRVDYIMWQLSDMNPSEKQNQSRSLELGPWSFSLWDLIVSFEICCSNYKRQRFQIFCIYYILCTIFCNTVNTSWVLESTRIYSLLDQTKMNPLRRNFTGTSLHLHFLLLRFLLPHGWNSLVKKNKKQNSCQVNV